MTLLHDIHHSRITGGPDVHRALSPSNSDASSVSSTWSVAPSNAQTMSSSSAPSASAPSSSSTGVERIAQEIPFGQQCPLRILVAEGTRSKQ